MTRPRAKVLRIAFVFVTVFVVSSLALAFRLDHHIREILVEAEETLLKSFRPYQVVLENARWPVQRFDWIQRARGKPTKEQVSIVSAQMLQLSFGFDHEYFALRSLDRTTRIEIRRGVLSEAKSQISILGEESFDEDLNGMMMRPCTISSKPYLCLLDFTIKRYLIYPAKRNYAVIALRPAEFLSVLSQGRAAYSYLGLEPEVRVILGDTSYPVSGEGKIPELFGHTVPIDPGFQLEASVETWAFVLLATITTTIIFLFSVGVYAAVQWRVRTRTKIGLESALLSHQLKHFEEIQKLVRGVIHDIQSPIAALRTCIHQTNDLEIRTLMSHVTKRLAMIIRDLEEKGQLESNAEAPATLPIFRILKLLVMEKSKEYEGKIKFVFTAFPNEKWVLGSYSSFFRMLSNLINNAAEASNENGQIWIECKERTASDISILIRDEGRGIPRKLLSRVMEEGVSHGKTGGKGLGLPAARQIVSKMGGEIAIESEVGVGTTVQVSLKSVSSPSWALTQLDLKSVTHAIVVDDEEEVFHVWREKLKHSAIKLQYLAHPTEVTDTHLSPVSTLLLMDNRFGDESNAGLHFLETHAHNPSILVTSDWQQADVQEAAARLNVRLIGKEFISQLSTAKS